MTLLSSTLAFMDRLPVSFSNLVERPYSGLTALVIYLIVVRLLRYQRRDHLQRTFHYPTRASFKRMTIEDAHAIQLALIALEFPQTFAKSVFFALFKTYGIPTISSLLVATGELASETTTSKRAADTGVILAEAVINKSNSERTADAIARMNYLHDRYRRARKISDEDMLYTLSLFTLEPIRWTDAYEWRPLTDLERCALGTFWKDLGDKMEIPYSVLPSNKIGWKDALHWLEELDSWSLDYEARHMLPADSNARLAAGTMDILLFNVPVKLRGMGKAFVAVLLGERLRTAMKFEKPSKLYFLSLNVVLTIRKLMLRYLSPPRPYMLRRKWFTENPDPRSGCFHSVKYFSHPWYVKPTFGSRWGPGALWTRLVGGVLPGDEGSKYAPEGYCVTELGPRSVAGKGMAEMDATRVKLQAMKRSCPFSVPSEQV